MLQRFERLFSEEVTLDSISRIQLAAMCKYMGLSTSGTDSFLRFKLCRKLSKIRADDRVRFHHL